MATETADVKVKVTIVDAKAVHAWPDFADRVHSNHPIYLHPSDNPGISPISYKLSGPKNYDMWNHSMVVTLQRKNKLSFVDGSFGKELFDSSLHALCDKCNVVIFGWIMNLHFGDLSSSIMYSTSVYLV